LKKRLHQVQKVLLEERLSRTATEQRADVAERNSKGLESRLKYAEQRVKVANHIIETTKNRTRDLGVVCSYQAVKVKELANMINLFLKKLGEYRTKNKLLRKIQINPDHFSAHPEFVDLPVCSVANKLQPSISLQRESQKVHDNAVEYAELADPQSGRRVCHLVTEKSPQAKKAIKQKQQVQVTKDVQDSLSEDTEMTDLPTESISESSTERYLVIKKGIERRQQHTRHVANLEDIEMTDSQSATSTSDLPAKKAPHLKKASKRREHPQGTNKSSSIEATCSSQPLSLVKVNQESERTTARLPLEIGMGKGSMISGSENKEPMTTVITAKTSHFVASLPLTSIVSQPLESRSPSSPQCKSPSKSPSPSSISKTASSQGDHAAACPTRAGSDKVFAAANSSAETPETVSLKDSNSCKLNSICVSPQNLSSEPSKLEKGCSPRSFASEASFLSRLLPMKKIIDDSMMFPFPASNGLPTSMSIITQDLGYMPDMMVHQSRAIDVAQESWDPCQIDDCSQLPVGKALQFEQEAQFFPKLEKERLYPHDPRPCPAQDKADVQGLNHEGASTTATQKDEEGDGLSHSQGEIAAGLWPADFMQQTEGKIDSQRSCSVSPQGKNPEFQTLKIRVPSPSSSVDDCCKDHELEEAASAVIIPLSDDILSLRIGDEEEEQHSHHHRELLACETNGEEVKIMAAVAAAQHARCPNGCETQNSSVPSPIYSDLLHAKCGPSPPQTGGRGSPVANSVDVPPEKSCKSCAAIQVSGGSTPGGRGVVGGGGASQQQQQQRGATTGWRRFFTKSEACQTNNNHNNTSSTPRPSFATTAMIMRGVEVAETAPVPRIRGGGGLAEFKTKSRSTTSVVHAAAAGSSPPPPPQLKLRLNTVQETFVQEDEEKSVIEKRAEELSKSCIYQARKLEEVSQQLQQFPARLDEQLKRWAALEAKRKYDEKVQALAAQDSTCNYGEEDESEIKSPPPDAAASPLKPSTTPTRPPSSKIVVQNMADTTTPPKSITRGKKTTSAVAENNNIVAVDQLEVVRMMKAIADVKVTFLRMRLKKLEESLKNKSTTAESSQQPPYKHEVEVWRVGSKLLVQTISLCFAISRLPSFVATFTSASFPT
jgi:hypothetical protein